MSPLILHYLTIWRPLGYLLVFLGLIFEGDIFVFTSAFLTKLNFFDVGDIIIVALLAILLGDSFWYWIGHRVNHSKIGIIRKLRSLAGKIEVNFNNNFFRKMLISKFAYGTHHLTLIKIGMSGMPWKKFIRVDFLGALIWMLVIGSLGYVFASSYELIHHYFKYVEIGLALSILIYFIVRKLGDYEYIKLRNNK